MRSDKEVTNCFEAVGNSSGDGNRDHNDPHKPHKEL
jgi:hypothetical protein